MTVPILKDPNKRWWDTPENAALNAQARAAGATEEALHHAHEVAAGFEHLSEACTNCEEQALRYQRRIRVEGRCAIICDNCGAHHHDANELGGIVPGEIKKMRKGLVGG